MNKMDSYKEEAIQRIEEARASLIESDEVFNKFAEQVKAIDPTVYAWFESGYEMGKSYDQMDIENTEEYLTELRNREMRYRFGAIKSAATRKANKLKVA
jgi:hypothetical protein